MSNMQKSIPTELQHNLNFFRGQT